MTVWIFILGLVFGFLAIRHFRNGRPIWGSVAAFGSLLMAGSVWVDYQRATAGPDEPAPSATLAAPAEAAPEIRDYQPSVPAADAGETAAP